MDVGLVAGVVAIGFIHGVLPDHGWPIAATYGLNRSRTWLYGTLAGLILGVGHLVSSVALVLAYFWFSRFAEFAEGPWMRYVAGTMLILLGLHEYRHGGHGTTHEHSHDDPHHDASRSHSNDHGHNHGHSHDHGHPPDHGHSHDHGHPPDHGHSHDHGHPPDHGHSDDHGHPHADTHRGKLSRLRARLFSGGGHRHLSEDDADRGLLALGMAALLLGFAHEEPIQILAICVGTPFCLELMLIYSLAVIVAILVPTLALIAGYERHRETVETYTPYLPLLTATVLVGMGLAFIVGIF